MSMVRICDGCGNQLTKGPAVTGTRDTRAVANQPPETTFDWCQWCAKIAFDAVRARNESAVMPR